MNHHIQPERLAETFTTLCEISSPSRRERAIADHLKQVFNALGASTIIEDGSSSATGSDSGNLIIRFAGNRPDIEGIFFSCHMDTVQPGEGVRVVREGDIFKSAGETILGGDDKSGIAAIIEMMQVIQERQLDHGLIEIVITTCEEIGLLGAKHLEHRLLTARYGYALDSSGIDTVIYGAPAANKFRIEVTGAAAHAGLSPEQGLSAIQVAALAITRVRLGRLDPESTANFGIISGGVATNIVPEKVVIEGEVRSHNPEKLVEYTREIISLFEKTVADWPTTNPDCSVVPKVRIETISEYPAMRLGMDDPVICRIREASRQAGRDLDFIVAGGGSDANIFNGFGLPTAIVATGMTKVHTTDEQLDLADLIALTELVLGLASPR